MSHIYAPKITYEPNVSLGNPSTELSKSSTIIYSETLDDYVEGAEKNIYLQYLDNDILVNNTFHLNIANSINSGPKIQLIKTINLYTNQFSLKNIFKNYIKVHFFNSIEILKYTKQFPLKNLFFSSKRIQSIKDNRKEKISRQRISRFMLLGKLQRINFTDRKKDKIIWSMRGIKNNEYFYWENEGINAYSNNKNELENSREVLHSYYITGSEIKKYHKNYILDNSTIEADMINHFTGTIDASGNLMEEKQTYTQKINLKDRREIQYVWKKRGLEQNKEVYTYWQDKEISTQNTTYTDTLEETREIINSNYERKE